MMHKAVPAIKDSEVTSSHFAVDLGVLPKKKEGLYIVHSKKLAVDDILQADSN